MPLEYARNVTIIGAAGQLGRVAVTALLNTGKHNVTAITRPESKSKIADGINVVRLDYTSEDNYVALVETLKHQQALIITLPVGTDPAVMQRLVRAADEAGVQYVMPNYWGMNPNNDAFIAECFLAPFRDGIYDTFKTTKTSKYLLLACGMWFEFSLAGGLDRYGISIRNRKFIRFDNEDVLMSVTTWPQIGRAIAGLLSLPLKSRDTQTVSLAQYANGPVYVASYHTTQRQMFEAVKRVTSTTDSDWAITQESVEERYQEAVKSVQGGDFAAFQRLLYSRQFFPSQDAYFEQRGLANKILGLPDEDYDNAVREAVRMAEAGEIADAKE